MAAGRGDKSAVGTVAAIVQAMRQSEAQVVAVSAAGPPVMDLLRRYVAEGLMQAELAPVEGDEQALATCLDAVQAGRRAMCVAWSHGLVAMHDALCTASALRLPIVMGVLSDRRPGTALCGDPDALGARDVGWIQMHAETPQEAYDSIIQAVRLAEHRQVRVPAMVVAPLSDLPAQVEGDAEVRAFAHAPYLPGRPEPERGALGLAIPLVHALGDEYGRLFGRRYAVLDTWGMADAELAVVALGAVAGAARAALGELRGQGVRVGLVRPRLFRPFPGRELAHALRRVRGVAILERSLSRGSADGTGAGPLHAETAAAFAAAHALPPLLLGFVSGAHMPGPDYVMHCVAELQEAVSAGRQEVTAHSLGSDS